MTVISMELQNLPIPPSVNELYANVRRARGSRGTARIKTMAYRRYSTLMAVWALKNVQHLDSAHRLVGRLKPTHVCRIDLKYRFHRSRVLTKAGVPKRLDLDNRLKALHDALCSVLGIDDRVIWEIRARKVVDLNEGVDVSLSFFDLSEPAGRVEKNGGWAGIKAKGGGAREC